jgi:hypothetical protein
MNGRKNGANLVKRAGAEVHGEEVRTFGAGFFERCNHDLFAIVPARLGPKKIRKEGGKSVVSSRSSVGRQWSFVSSWWVVSSQ